MTSRKRRLAERNQAGLKLRSRFRTAPHRAQRPLATEAPDLEETTMGPAESKGQRQRARVKGVVSDSVERTEGKV